MKNSGLLTILFITLFSVVLPVVWFNNGLIKGTGESGLPFYNLKLQYDLTKYSWSGAMLGNSRGIGLASLPLDWVLASAQSIRIDNYIIEAIFFGSLFLISGLSIYKLTSTVFPTIGNKYYFASVLFYWFNPTSLVNVWNRFLYNYMVFWALLPLALYLFLKGIIVKKFKYSLILSLSTVLFSYALSSPAFNILFWIMLSGTAMFLFIVKYCDRLFIVKYYVLSMVCYLLLNTWWILQLLTFMVSSGYSSAIENFFSSEGNYEGLELLSDLLGRFVNNFRYLHGTFFDSGPVWARYFTYPGIKSLQYIVPAIIIWAIYAGRKKVFVLLFGTLYLLSLFLMKGIGQPFGILFQQLFLSSTIFQVFRNPFEKFSLIYITASAILFAYGFYLLMNNPKIKTTYKTLLNAGVFIFLIAIWGFPFLSGYVFKSTDIHDNKKLRDVDIEVPNYYDSANTWLMSQKGDFRFITFPMGGEGISYTWKHPYSGVELSSAIFNSPNISFNTTIPFYSDIAGALEPLFLNNDKFYVLANLLNAKYIVLRKDIDWKEDGIRDPLTIEKFIERKPGLYKKEQDFGNVSIYSINGIEENSKIRVSVQGSLVYPNALLSDYLLFDVAEDGFISDAPIQQPKPVITDIIVKPVAMHFMSYGPNLYENDNDALAALLYVKHLPGSYYYPLVKVKEDIERGYLSSMKDRFIFDINHLGKRMVEVYRIALNNPKHLDFTVKNYWNTFKKMENEYNNGFENNMSNYNIDLIYEEFNKHLFILNKAIDKLEVKEEIVILENMRKSLHEKMLLYGLAQNEAGLVLNLQHWLYRINVPEDGVYELLLHNNKIYDYFVINTDNPLKVVLDSSEERYVQDYYNKELLSFGSTFFNKGYNEIVLPNLEAKNLVGDYKSEYIVNSSVNNLLLLKVAPFVPDASYNIEFDYYIETGDGFGMYVNHDFLNPENFDSSDYFQDFSTDPYFHGYKHEKVRYTPTTDFDKMEIGFVVKEYNDCLKYLSGKRANLCKVKSFSQKYNRPTQVHIKNLSVKRIFDSDIFLKKDGKSEYEGKSPQISYQKKDPTEYTVNITNATTPYVLMFSELFNSGWKISFEDGYNSESIQHLRVNVYANGWYINREGDYKLSIRFSPQKLLNKGKYVSMVSFAAIVSLYLYLAVSKSKTLLDSGRN